MVGNHAGRKRRPSTGHPTRLGRDHTQRTFQRSCERWNVARAVSPVRPRRQREHLDDADGDEPGAERALQRLVAERRLCQQRRRRAAGEGEAVEHALGHARPAATCRSRLVVRVKQQRRDVDAGEVREGPARAEREVQRDGDGPADEQREQGEQPIRRRLSALTVWPGGSVHVVSRRPKNVPHSGHRSVLPRRSYPHVTHRPGQ